MTHNNSNICYFKNEDLIGLKPCAQGTVATVYSAKLDGMTVAVKTLKKPHEITEPTTRERSVSDFENEVFINSQLRHPNILLYIGCIRTSRLESLIFEFSSEGTLNCENYGPSRISKGLPIAISIGRALAYAHRLNIMHRDIKPSQILMFPGDLPKIGDWGFASHMSDDGTATGETGTWEYMAPEVIRSEKYDVSADVFSFAILLYCIVMGCTFPYMDKFLTPEHAAMGVAKNNLRPTLSSQIPDCVSVILKSCWGNSPKSRPTMPEAVQMLINAEQSLSSKNSKSKSSSWFWS